jgi:hypothetical protein
MPSLVLAPSRGQMQVLRSHIMHRSFELAETGRRCRAYVKMIACMKCKERSRHGARIRDYAS